MRELIRDPFYKLIGNYENHHIDYFLIKEDTPHCGYRSHKDAVLFAMIKLIERNLNNQLKFELRILGKASDESPMQWNLDIGKAHAHQIEPAALFYVPEIIQTGCIDQRIYDCELSEPIKGEQVPYWYAFYTSENGSDEFRKVNSALFPEGLVELEVYEWTTDWSNHFYNYYYGFRGGCWSIYDKRKKRYAVIIYSE